MKIYHISMKFNRLLIFVVLYILQCKIEGHAVEKKKCFTEEKIKRNFLCAKILRKSIVNGNALYSDLWLVVLGLTAL